MNSSNVVSLFGRLGADPELKTIGADNAVATFNVAVQRPTKEKEVDWVPVQFWGRSAENVTKFFKKGDPIILTGSIRIDSWTSDDGTRRNKTYVNADSFSFVGGGKKTDVVGEADDFDVPF